MLFTAYHIAKYTICQRDLADSYYIENIAAAIESIVEFKVYRDIRPTITMQEIIAEIQLMQIFWKSKDEIITVLNLPRNSNISLQWMQTKFGAGQEGFQVFERELVR